MNGLAHSQANVVFIDSREFLWVGTAGGLSRFDGNEFVNYSMKDGLANNDIQDIAEDAKGRLWLATKGGLSSFDGEKFINYDRSDGFPFASANLMFATRDSTELWIYNTFHGVCRVDVSGENAVFHLFTENDGLVQNHCDLIAEDASGNIWFGGHSQATRTNNLVPEFGVSVIHGNQIQNYSRKDGLPCDSVIALMAHPNGYIYIATEKGMVRTNSREVQFEQVPFERIFGFQSDRLYHYTRIIYTDKEHNIWYGTDMVINDTVYGVFVREDIQTGQLTRFISVPVANTVMLEDTRGFHYFVGDRTIIRVTGMESGNTRKVFDVPYKWAPWITDANGLKTSEFYGRDAFAIDREGSIWFANTTEGISRFSDNGFSLFNREHGLPHHQVWCITQGPDGKLYFGTDAGVVAWDGRHMASYDQCSGVRGLDTYALTFDRFGNFWNGHGSGRISVSDTKGNCTMMQPTKNAANFNSGGTWSIVEGNDSCLWTGTLDGGIFRYYNGQWQQLYGVLSGDSIFVTAAFHIVRGTEDDIWFAAINCLSRYDGNKFSSIPASNLSGGYVLSLAYDHYHNRLWVGTSKGLVSVKLKSGRDEPEIQTYFTGSESEDPMNIYCLLIDRAKNIWVGHSNGLHRVKLLDNGKLGEITKFHKSNGFWPVETMQNAIHQAQNGEIWIGSAEGLVRFQPTLEKIKTTPPLIHLTETLIDFKAIDWDSLKYETGFFSMPEKLVLDYHQNHVTIGYTAINFTSPELTRFRYRLIRNDEQENWSPEITMREVTFPNLSPGNYDFQLQASNAGQEWSETTSFHFEITPPFWQTTGFYLSSAFSFGILFFIFVKYRERKLKRDKRVLDKQVQLRTEEVRAAYDEISDKNKEITSSIEYAKRIQNAVFPTPRFMTETLGEYFIFYRPKDIIAGDFYWADVQDGITYFAAADCTGHGVPGAMVSVMCNSALNRSVREFDLRRPAEILDKVRQLILAEFEKSGADVKDGMDISLASLDRQKKMIHFAGAHNPLWIIHPDGNFTELKPDKQPVGKFEFSTPFQQQQFSLRSGDMIFSFTDGFADQFGGPRGKKYKYQPLKEFLITGRNLSCEEQRNRLVAEFDSWKKGYEQIDDVCVFGVRIS